VDFLEEFADAFGVSGFAHTITRKCLPLLPLLPLCNNKVPSTNLLVEDVFSAE
jgi:hypothetical protein